MAALAVASSPSLALAQRAAPEDPPAPRAESPWGAHLALRAGYAMRLLYGVPIDNGTFSLSAGARRGAISFFARIDLLQGATHEGLAFDTREFGVGLEGSAGRVRLGLALMGGAVHVARITKDTTLNGATFGGRGYVTFDLLQWRRDGGLFLGLEASVATVGNGALYGPSAFAGVRVF